MRIIKKLCAMIDDEIDGAITYAENAVLYKDDEPELARMFAELADAELKHISRLHEEVVEFIGKARDSGVTVPTGMMETYTYLHERHIERANEVRNYLTQYRT